MSKRKTIVITAIITCVATLTLSFGALAVYNSGILSMIGVSMPGGYTENTLKRAENIIESAYYEDVDKDKLYEGAIAGMMNSLGDQYSWFVNEESYKNLEMDLGGEYTGIGVHVTIDPADETITVVTPIEDTPAYKAGIKSGDKIIEIDGIKVGYANYQEAINLMRKTPDDVGDTINLKIIRDGKEDEVSLVREKIILKTVKAKLLPNEVGYIRITSFDEKTYDEFEENLKNLGKDKLKGLVIDLRNNGGGTLTSTQKIADELLPKGLITYFQYKNGSKQEFNSDEQFFDIPLTILINGSSASASEVLAGAIRDHKRGTLVGEKSFGKGIVQTVLPFTKTNKGETAIYITTARYFTPNGECIHGKGIMPDIEVKLPEELKEKNFEDLTMDQDVQLKTAWQETIKKMK